MGSGAFIEQLVHAESLVLRDRYSDAQPRTRDTELPPRARRQHQSFLFHERYAARAQREHARETVGFWLYRDINGWDHSIEATYRGPDNWHREFNFEGFVPGAIFNPLNFALGGANGPDAAIFYYKSQFDSAELNLRWTKRTGNDAVVYNPDGVWRQEAEDGGVFSFVLGLRDTQLDEKYDGIFFSSGAPFSQFGSSDHVGTRNNLLGINVGGEVDYHHDLWYVGARIKGAPCINFAEMNRSLVFNDAGTGVSGSRSENLILDGPAFVTEFSLLAGWQLTPAAVDPGFLRFPLADQRRFGAEPNQLRPRPAKANRCGRRHVSQRRLARHVVQILIVQLR